jgi:hypothetical protein
MTTLPLPATTRDHSTPGWRTGQRTGLHGQRPLGRAAGHMASSCGTAAVDGRCPRRGRLSQRLCRPLRPARPADAATPGRRDFTFGLKGQTPPGGGDQAWRFAAHCPWRVLASAGDTDQPYGVRSSLAPPRRRRTCRVSRMTPRCSRRAGIRWRPRLAVLAAGEVGKATSLVTKAVMPRSVRAQAAAPWRQAGWPVSLARDRPAPVLRGSRANR